MGASFMAAAGRNRVSRLYSLVTPVILHGFVSPEVWVLGVGARGHGFDMTTPGPACLSSILKEIGILLPNNQLQRRALHIQKDVLPYALC